MLKLFRLTSFIVFFILSGMAYPIAHASSDSSATEAHPITPTPKQPFVLEAGYIDAPSTVSDYFFTSKKCPPNDFIPYVVLFSSKTNNAGALQGFNACYYQVEVSGNQRYMVSYYNQKISAPLGNNDGGLCNTSSSGLHGSRSSSVYDGSVSVKIKGTGCGKDTGSDPGRLYVQGRTVDNSTTDTQEMRGLNWVVYCYPNGTIDSHTISPNSWTSTEIYQNLLCTRAT